VTVLVGTPVTGPVLLLQVIPLTPITDQVAVPVGVAPPVGPATVAVKVKVEPRVAVGDEVVTVMVGATLEMTREKAVDGPAEV
jgi:hypothetical protein